MDSIIEVQRQTHEEIEHFERALYQILAKPQNVHQQRVQNDHKASQILDRISSRVTTLHNLYHDQDARKVELDSLAGSSTSDDLTEFYNRLGKIQEHHAKYPDAIIDGFELELYALLDEPMDEEVDDEYEADDRECRRIACISILNFGQSCWNAVLRRGGIWQILGLVC
jgi:splicing factor 3A subunit 3